MYPMSAAAIKSTGSIFFITILRSGINPSRNPGSFEFRRSKFLRPEGLSYNSEPLILGGGLFGFETNLLQHFGLSIELRFPHREFVDAQHKSQDVGILLAC